jgi:pimeloyl-ACP methyl ester carboxylesterase
MFLPPVKKMVGNFQRSELKVIEGCGHVCNIEEPDLFNEISIEYLIKQSSDVHEKTVSE